MIFLPSAVQSSSWPCSPLPHSSTVGVTASQILAIKENYGQRGRAWSWGLWQSAEVFSQRCYRSQCCFGWVTSSTSPGTRGDPLDPGPQSDAKNHKVSAALRSLMDLPDVPSLGLLSLLTQHSRGCISPLLVEMVGWMPALAVPLQLPPSVLLAQLFCF